MGQQQYWDREKPPIKGDARILWDACLIAFGNDLESLKREVFSRNAPTYTVCLKDLDYGVAHGNFDNVLNKIKNPIPILKEELERRQDEHKKVLASLREAEAQVQFTQAALDRLSRRHPEPSVSDHKSENMMTRSDNSS